MGLWDRFLRRTETLGEKISDYLEPTEEEMREFRKELEQAEQRTLLENAKNELKEDPFLVVVLIFTLIGFVYGAWTFARDVTLIWKFFG